MDPGALPAVGHLLLAWGGSLRSTSWAVKLSVMELSAGIFSCSAAWLASAT
ncbi:MAG: hypothetical protein R2911_20890 [Caldilineaceae bacterium]